MIRLCSQRAPTIILTTRPPISSHRLVARFVGQQLLEIVEVHVVELVGQADIGVRHSGCEGLAFAAEQ